MFNPTSPSSGDDTRGRAAATFDRTFGVDSTHRIRFTIDGLDPDNTVLRDVLAADTPNNGRAVVFIDQGVADAWPAVPTEIERYAAAHPDRLTICSVETVVGGEASKNDERVAEAVRATVDREHICRQSYVIAIGGGAVLDAVGYGALTAHRGVRLIRFPTTTLAQGDAGIGVKNGINAFGKKNFIGTFSVPWAVINDERYLASLDDADWRAGFSEAVKVAVLKDAAFFERVGRAAPLLRARDGDAARSILRRTAELHLDHIACGGDPFELLDARPLDFGHWSAHKLEHLSRYEMRHGDAVAIGLAIDAHYAREMRLLPGPQADAIVECLRAIGFVLESKHLRDTDSILAGLEEFREHLGGRLTITLLADIGRPIDVHTIDTACMTDAIQAFAC